MAWYWPAIQDQTSAEAAVKPAIGVSGFIAGMSGLVAILSIAYQKPIFGFDGWSLVDAALFCAIAWRIKKMSRAWAIVGLVMYLFEVLFNFATNKRGAVGILTFVFILTYIGAVRGAFAFHRYRTTEHSSDPAISADSKPV